MAGQSGENCYGKRPTKELVVGTSSCCTGEGQLLRAIALRMGNRGIPCRVEKRNGNLSLVAAA